MVRRIYVIKSDQGDFASKALCKELNEVLGLKLKSAKKLVRYDIEGLSDEVFEKARDIVFADSKGDMVIEGQEAFDKAMSGKKVLQISLLDGQYDLRADGVAECLKILTFEKLNAKSCDVYALEGASKADFEKVKEYLFNSVDSEIASTAKIETLRRKEHDMGPMRIEIEGFIGLDEKGLEKFHDDEGLAMTIADLKVVYDHFKGIGRNPTVTELKAIDTYWSDHCRHTTFLTELKDIEIKSKNKEIEKTFARYLDLHKELFKGRKDKYVCLMDVATIAARFLRENGIMTDQEISDEINACSVKAKIDNDGVMEDWLIMFKNETHNHPTEMEPYGGAGTCLGGAIRDPLSGRAYVYQAMRITAAGNILEDIEKTLPSKLPQRTLSTTAMRGYSSYGNQIGIASGQLNEMFHDRFRAKRMEAGYVIGASRQDEVVRKQPKKGDMVLLVGGPTGRDGIGGATGSSRAQTSESFEEAGAEVQKGNAAEERKIIRLYDNPEASKMIIKSNDFGAGGVSVAIGELADGLDIYLDKVPVKYQLNATEIAISESQERMAVVIEPENFDRFVEIASAENLQTTHVATVTDLNRMRQFYKDEVIVDLDRNFLNTNGAHLTQKVKVKAPSTDWFEKACGRALNFARKNSLQTALSFEAAKMNNCSQQGIASNFDATVGGLTVFAPYGGATQKTPTSVMASKPPVTGYTKTVTCSSYGIYPELMIKSPYVGAMHSVIASISKLVAAGVAYDTIFMSYQEFFKRLDQDAVRWGEPLEALLGAFKAQMDLELGSIGGKDSMSGSFEGIDVPPTLISFAMGRTTDDRVLSSDFPTKGNVYVVDVKRDEFGNIDVVDMKEKYLCIEKNVKAGKIKASTVVENNIALALTMSLLGNKAGIELEGMDVKELFTNKVGEIILVSDEKLECKMYRHIGKLDASYEFKLGSEKADLEAVERAYSSKLDSIYPREIASKEKIETLDLEADMASKGPAKTPKALVPVFLGSLGEKEIVKAFARAGAKVEEFVFKSLDAKDVRESLDKLASAIDGADIFAFGDALTCGDELDGTAKMAATILSHEKINAKLKALLARNGLILGLGGAMEALLKSGFILEEGNAWMDQNSIAKYVSSVSRVRVSSNSSPWMASFGKGEQFMVPVSTGKGRFSVDEKTYASLVANGQIAAQFVDEDGKATMSVPANPTGSQYAIESLTSKDGKVLAKLGHAERYAKGTLLNIPGNHDMNIFANAVAYFGK